LTSLCGRGHASIHEPGVSAPGSRSLRELKASGSIRTVRGLCRASRTVAICPLRGARAAWRLTWSRSSVSDYAARNTADDGAYRAADDGARDCAAYDSGNGSIAVG
jgi:hypothetical protein